MKNKGVTVFLLVAVMLIWGVLIYKVYNSVRGKEVITKRQATELRENSYVLAPSFQIHSYPNDPFLAILTDTAREPIIVADKPPKLEKPAMILPVYLGVIESSKTKTAILKINKKIFFVHEGEMLQSMKIRKIGSDSITATANGNTIVIPINKNNKKRER